jgi:hypothetical protein
MPKGGKRKNFVRINLKVSLALLAACMQEAALLLHAACRELVPTQWLYMAAALCR